MWQVLLAKEQIKNVRSYLYRIANNLIIDHYRKKKPISLDELNEQGFDVAEDTRAELENFIAGGQAMDLLANLSDEYRQVVIMRYVDDYSVAEIAEIIDISPNLVSVRLNRALKKLRSIFNHE